MSGRHKNTTAWYHKVLHVFVVLQKPFTERPGDGRHLQILVHQISSSDLVLCTPAAACAKLRHMYSTDRETCELLLSKTSKDFAEGSTTLLTANTEGVLAKGVSTPIGIQFNSCMSIPHQSVVLRNEVSPQVSPVEVSGLLFPVVAALIPTWIEEVHSRTSKRQAADGGSSPKRILYLISGPSVQAGPEHEAEGSSDGIALLLTRFMRCVPCNDSAFLISEWRCFIAFNFDSALQDSVS